ncbi:MAG: S9 family peptidase, partial [Phycisphaerales bacterium]
MKCRLFGFVCALAGVMGTNAVLSAGPIEYPLTRMSDVVDIYHGVEVPDPYRWLEDDVRVSEEVAAWVEEQNRVTFGVLEQIPHREAIRARLMEMLDYERYTSPFIAAGRYYYYRNDGLQNHSVLYTTGDSLDGEPEVVIDPNLFSEDGTTALAGVYFSPDGRYMAYYIQEGGSDWRKGFVRDLKTGMDLPDKLEWIKFSAASWKRDGSGFFYSRYPEPDAGTAFTGRNSNHMLYIL